MRRAFNDRATIVRKNILILCSFGFNILVLIELPSLSYTFVHYLRGIIMCMAFCDKIQVSPPSGVMASPDAVELTEAKKTATLGDDTGGGGWYSTGPS